MILRGNTSVPHFSTLCTILIITTRSYGLTESGQSRCVDRHLISTIPCARRRTKTHRFERTGGRIGQDWSRRMPDVAGTEAALRLDGDPLASPGANSGCHETLLKSGRADGRPRRTATFIGRAAARRKRAPRARQVWQPTITQVSGAALCARQDASALTRARSCTTRGRGPKAVPV